MSQPEFEKSESPSLRILTLNTHKGFSALNKRFILHELREAIRAANADIVFLQEVVGENELHAETVDNWPEKSHYEFLADSLWNDFAYGKNAVYPSGHHGNAILSRYPIRKIQHLDISTYQLEKRGLLHCAISLPSGQTLHCICIHLGLFGFHRRAQFKMVAKFVEEHIPEDALFVLAGDFNDWLGGAHKLFTEKMHCIEAHHHLHRSLAKTFPSRMPLLTLDRIYLRNLMPKTSLVYSQDPWHTLSDHCALLAEVTA